MELFKDVEQLVLIMIILIIILFVWSLILSFKLSSVLKKIKRFTRGGKMIDFEKVIEKYISEAEEMKKEIKDNEIQINTIADKISNLKGRVEIIRYNAFDNEGQDLSYSISFLDEKRNGIIITSIYNRDGSNTYAKPIIEGTSKYKLSREEIMVLENATKYK